MINSTLSSATIALAPLSIEKLKKELMSKSDMKKTPFLYGVVEAAGQLCDGFEGQLRKLGWFSVVMLLLIIQGVWFFFVPRELWSNYKGQMRVFFVVFCG